MVLKELGHGNGGTVSKVRHVATNTVMARKVRVSGFQKAFPTGLTFLGYTRRGKNGNAPSDSSRVANYAQYQLGLYCHLLWGVPERKQRRYYVYGIYGRRVFFHLKLGIFAY